MGRRLLVCLALALLVVVPVSWADVITVNTTFDNPIQVGQANFPSIQTFDFYGSVVNTSRVSIEIFLSR